MSAKSWSTFQRPGRLWLVLASVLAPAPLATASVLGELGPDFELRASAGYISTPDGASIYAWGYSAAGAPMQYPGPTLLVNQGATVEVTLTNDLPAVAGNVSIVFQGHDLNAVDGDGGVADGIEGGVPGLLTQEAVPGGSVTYRFVAGKPGTYLYSSGTRADLQVEMGLFGALIVYPSGGPGCAYSNAGTCYDRENLFVLSEADLDIHRTVEIQVAAGGPIEVATSPYYDPEYWFINGRCAPDTMAADGDATLPSQPYSAITRMVPGERLLLRVVGAGRQAHPFHHHGNHARVLARDGQLLENGSGQLVGPSVFTITSVPGGTTDAIFEWTGKGLNWDVYGSPHVNGPDTCNGLAGPSLGFDPTTREYCPDHTKAIPVQLPELQQLTFGGFWSGSPYLGVLGSLPPGEGGLNPFGAYTYMWHSHSEREIINNDIFPGGMMTMLVIEPPGTEIP
ncbi:MAG TPA: multicopper oxidase domain-containing protein [Vicinamibacteria bacterium]|nr:multicopper oxidase domain-containing protein [Vicinamibacteria bacterium]